MGALFAPCLRLQGGRAATEGNWMANEGLRTIHCQIYRQR